MSYLRRKSMDMYLTIPLKFQKKEWQSSLRTKQINSNRIKIILIIFQIPYTGNHTLWRLGSRDAGNWREFSDSRQQTCVKSTEGVNQDATVEICIISNKKNKNFSNPNPVILSPDKTSTHTARTPGETHSESTGTHISLQPFERTSVHSIQSRSLWQNDHMQP